MTVDNTSAVCCARLKSHSLKCIVKVHSSDKIILQECGMCFESYSRIINKMDLKYLEK